MNVIAIASGKELIANEWNGFILPPTVMISKGYCKTLRCGLRVGGVGYFADGLDVLLIQ